MLSLPESPQENPEARIIPEKEPQPSPFGWLNRMLKWMQEGTRKDAKPESKKPA